MFKLKICISIIIFSFLIIFTSIVKNQARSLEKKIYNLEKVVQIKEKDLYESQLDFAYITSPSNIDQKISRLDLEEYYPMEYSKIFLDISNLINLEQKIVTQDKHNEKKIQKK